MRHSQGTKAPSRICWPLEVFDEVEGYEGHSVRIKDRLPDAIPGFLLACGGRKHRNGFKTQTFPEVQPSHFRQGGVV